MIVAQRLAILTAILTVVLIGVGAFVRATGSGLGCPDWPLCYGQAVPPAHQEAWIEFSHRFVASVVGLLVISVAVAAWKYYRHVPLITWVATATVPLVGFQGLLGAITVVRELPPEIVATHLVTAMLVLSCVVTVAVGMWMEDERHRGYFERTRGIGRVPGRWALAGLAWLAVTFWVGGYMAESGAATACSGWPLCNGGVLPGADDQEITHMIHRYLAGAFVFLVVPALVTAWRRRDALPWAKPYVIVLGTLYAAQVLVGALNVWFTFPDPLTVTHTAVAGSIWGVLSAGAALGFYEPFRAVAGTRAAARAEAPA
jgi:heme A synthase